MKKIVSFVLLASLIVCLCGCSARAASGAPAAVQTLKGWVFQYNENVGEYNLFFGLLDSKGNFVASAVDADIRIEDQSGNILYNEMRSVSEKDFGVYSNKIVGKRLMANVRIKASELAEGVSASGTVYLTVYKDGELMFDEVNCNALNCLPIKGITLQAEEMPMEVELKDYFGKTESVIRIEEMSYEVDSRLSSRIDVTISGTKTVGDGNSFDVIKYKVYDSGGYMVDSGSVFLHDLSAGDKFKDDSITVYDATPGENYTIRFSDDR